MTRKYSLLPLSFVLLAFLVVAALGTANASPAAFTVSGLTVWPNNDNQDWSLGFEFTVSSPVTVSALGYNYFDVPLNASHLVGIYDSTQTLLTSATVDNGSTISNGYLYTSVSPVVLGPGNYWITGTTLGLNDGWTYQATSIVGASGLTYDGSWFTAGNGGMLSFPVSFASGRQYMEVNFLIGSTVPEPGTLMLVGTGVLGALATLRRRFLS